MAISIGDAILKLGLDSSSLDAGLKGIKSKLGEISTAWAGVGVGIMAGMGLMVKAAAEEEANIGRLSIALKNVGISYDSVKDSLEGVISATQKKTGIADSAQRDALNKLLIITGDYNKSLKALPVVLDLAAASQMDASSAATMLGRALEGSTTTLKRYGINIKEGATETEILAEIIKRTKGAAEAAANPFNVLGAEIGDVGEAIGSVLLPTIRDLIGRFVDILGKVKDWVALNPQLVKALAAGAIAIAGVITAVFALKAALLLLGSTANLMFGGILILVGALVTGITLLVQNWDKITNLFASGTVKAERAAKEMTATIKAELEKQKAAAEATYATQKADAQSLYDNTIENIRKEYGMLKVEAKNKIDLARDASDATRKALDDELRNAQKIHSAKMDLLQREYDQKIKTLNAEADAQTASIQSQIDAIDRQTEQEDLFLTRQAEQKRLATLSGTEYIEYAEEIARNELLRTRNAEKDALRDRISDIRTRAQTEADRLATELEANQSHENTLWELFQRNLTLKSSALDTALETELKRLDDERIGKEQLELDALTATTTRLANEEIAIKESYGRRLKEASLYQAALRAIESGKATAPTTPPGIFSKEWLLQGFQHGGVISEPTLLYGLKSMRPYAVAHEGERVTPGLGEVVITGNNFYVREESDIDRVAEALIYKIRQKTGVRI